MGVVVALEEGNLPETLSPGTGCSRIQQLCMRALRMSVRPRGTPHLGLYLQCCPQALTAPARAQIVSTSLYMTWKTCRWGIAAFQTGVVLPMPAVASQYAQRVHADCCALMQQDI